jgi:hypothetical protein
MLVAFHRELDGASSCLVVRLHCNGACAFDPAPNAAAGDHFAVSHDRRVLRHRAEDFEHGVKAQ